MKIFTPWRSNISRRLWTETFAIGSDDVAATMSRRPLMTVSKATFKSTQTYNITDKITWSTCHFDNGQKYRIAIKITDYCASTNNWVLSKMHSSSGLPGSAYFGSWSLNWASHDRRGKFWHFWQIFHIISNG